MLALFFSAIQFIIYCNTWPQMYSMHSKESGRETKGFDLMPLTTVPQSSCKMTKIQNQSLSTTLLPHLGQNSSRGSQGVTSPSPGSQFKGFPTTRSVAAVLVHLHTVPNMCVLLLHCCAYMASTEKEILSITSTRFF